MNKGLKIALTIIGGVAVLVLVVLTAIGGIYRSYWGWGMNRYGMMGGFGSWWMIIPMVIIVGVVIWGIVALAGSGRCRRHEEHGDESPQEILRRRYAKGEINKEEFEQKKKDLQ